MKIRSAVLENGCLEFFCDGRKKQKKQKMNKKQKKTSVKHIRIRLIGGRRLRKLMICSLVNSKLTINCCYT